MIEGVRVRYRRTVLDVFRGSERFTVVRELGVGGMCAVYEVLDRERDEHVALKLLQRLDAQALLRFKAEFRLARDIRHRNLVRLDDLIAHRGRWFFTMELVAGRSITRHSRVVRQPSTHDLPASAPLAAIPPSALTQWLGQERVLDQARLRSAIGQLASALSALHDAGQVHRDIKPSNVLVTDSGRVVLLDFGVTRALHVPSNLSSGAVVGTSEYMAPEQAMGHPATTSADWYSVGVLLYEALTGEVPFKGDHVAICLSKYSGERPRARDHGSDIPDDLDELCFRLMDSRPDHRADGDDIMKTVSEAPVRPVASDAASDVADDIPGETRHHDAHEALVASRAWRACTGRAVRFVGRTEPLLILEQAVDVSQCSPVSVLIRGPSGSGKTALVEELGEHLNALVLIGRCLACESIPYNGLDAAIDTLTHWLADCSESRLTELLPEDVGFLAQLFPAMQRVRSIARSRVPVGARQAGISPRTPRHPGSPDPTDSLRHRALSALAELLRRIARTEPIVFAIDDGHRADRETLSALASLATAPIVLVVTELSDRSSDSPALSSRSARLDRAVTWTHDLELGPLPPEQATILASTVLQHIAGAASPERAQAIADGAEGDPAFVCQLAAMTAAHGTDPALPTTTSELVCRQLAELDPPARHLIDLLCIARAPLPRAAYARASDLRADEFARITRVLADRHLLRSDGSCRADTIELGHRRIREIVATTSPATRGRETTLTLHRSLARALEASADQTGDPAGTDIDREPDHDARLAERWLAARIRAVPRRPTLARALAEHALAAGHAATAGEALLAAAQASDPPDSTHLHLRAAEAFLRCGQTARGLTLWDQFARADDLPLFSPLTGDRLSRSLRRFGVLRINPRRLQRAEPRGSRSTTAGARPDTRCHDRVDSLAGAVLGLLDVDPQRAVDAQAEHLRRAARRKDLDRVQRALAFELIVSTAASTRARTRDKLAALLDELTRLCDTREASDWADLAHGIAAVHAGRFAAGRNALTRCRHVGKAATLAARYRICAEICLGEITSAQATLGEAMARAVESDEQYGQATLALAESVLVELARDRPERAEDGLTRARQHIDPGHVVPERDAVLGEATVGLYRGEPDRALTLLHGLSHHDELSRFARIRASDLASRAHVAAAGTIDPATAQGTEPATVRSGHIARALIGADTLEREHTPWSSALALAIRAGCAYPDESPAGSPALWSRAADAFHALSLPLHHHACAWRHGQFSRSDSAAGPALDGLDRHGVSAPARFADMLAPTATRPPGQDPSC